ncbi:hypothetical protein [Caproicibacterium sp. XB2]|uniref:hypothetical protein n=1 Tax=Caproicibacterium sp. XB2 TaxID=3388458 RepID=UPI00384CED3B
MRRDSTAQLVQLVAPYTGAWIEIRLCSIRSCCAATSLPTRERGLKSNVIAAFQRIKGRSLHGSVD